MNLLIEAERKQAPEARAAAKGDDSATLPTLPVRVAARAIDVLVVTAVDVGLGLRMGFGVGWLIVGAAIVLAYFALCDRFAGATLGKLALGLRVVGPGGGRPSLRQAVIRESCMVVGAVPFAGPLLALTAWIWIALSIRSNPLGQGKHDVLAGGTRVVRKVAQP
jgi:uncharacterized RDD family membrane protein YckC